MSGWAKWKCAAIFHSVMACTNPPTPVRLGSTWVWKSYAIGTIAINPANPDIVYVAAMGKVFGANPDRGLYRSKDGGQTWQLVLKKDDSTGCADVKNGPVKPADIVCYNVAGASHPVELEQRRSRLRLV